MERKYKFGAIAYVKLLQLQEKVDDLDYILSLSGAYIESYEHNISTLTNTIGMMLDQLEFKYK